jgi:hypothetical protein
MLNRITIDVRFFVAGNDFAVGQEARRLSPRTYSYLITPAQAEYLAANPKTNLAVVRAPKDDGGYKVVQIVGVPSEKPASAEKFIIQLVDTSAYTATLEKQKLAATLRRKIEGRAAAMAEETRLAALASNDPTMRQLLDELKALDV